MDLWIRSTAKTNLINVRFLTIMEGKTFYKKDEWEYKGYTICNVGNNGNYEIVGTYKTKERALEVLDEIQSIIYINKLFNADINAFQKSLEIEGYTEKEIGKILKKVSTYEMPKE